MFKQKLLTLACVLMLTVALLVPSSAAAHTAAEVTNPGFEADNDVTSAPQGWTLPYTWNQLHRVGRAFRRLASLQLER